MKNNENNLFLKGKPYILSFFVAYSSLVLIASVADMLELVGPLDGFFLLTLAVSVSVSCLLMSFTDKIPLKSNFMIGIVDILDITVTVFGLNFLYALNNDTWFSFEPVMIITILVTIVLTYTATCVVFFLVNIKNERQINAKIKMMKTIKK